MRVRVWAAMVALVGAGATPAFGQTPKEKSAAEALFRDGRAAYERADFRTACAKFEESRKLDPASGTLLNIAVCQERLGNLVLARTRLAELMPMLGPKDDRLELAADLAAKLDARIPHLRLLLAPSAPPETSVNEEPGGGSVALGVDTTLNPGPHGYVITAPGRPTTHLSLTLAEGDRTTRQVGPGEADTGPVDDAASARTRRIIGFAAAGVGLAGFLVAGATGAALLDKKSALDAHCPNQGCDATGLKLLADDRSTPVLPINTAGWVAGIVGAGAGALLLLTSTPAVSVGTGRVGTGPGVVAAGRF